MSDHYDAPTPVCWHCGEPCSGESLESIDVDGMLGWACVCDGTCGK